MRRSSHSGQDRDQRAFNLNRHFRSLGASGAAVRPVLSKRSSPSNNNAGILYRSSSNIRIPSDAENGVVDAVSNDLGSENDSFVTDDDDDDDEDAIRERVRAIVRNLTSDPAVRHVDAQSDGHRSENLADTDDDEEENGGAVNEYQLDDFVCADDDSDSDG